MVTKQKTFDTVVAHLRRQGCKSADLFGCLFRGPNGLKCAAGCLIPDSDYDPKWENYPKDALDYLREAGHDNWLLSDLILCHDKRDVNDWEAKFKTIAEHYGLIYETIN